MKIKHAHLYLLACIGITGCQAINDTLATVNGTLSSVNSALAGNTVSAATQSSADAALTRVKLNNNTKTLFNQAKPAISKYIALIACDTPPSVLTAYSDPNSVAPNGLGMPQNEMNYHKSGCLNILRIENINKLAANTLQFQVAYISPQSEETVRKTYQAIQQPSGEWLFDFWGL